MADEIKVVIALKGSQGFIGVQAPNCDPIFATLEGGLEAALGRVPGLLEEALRRWEANPRYPKAERPTPIPMPEPPPQLRAAQQAHPARPAPQCPQPSMF